MHTEREGIGSIPKVGERNGVGPFLKFTKFTLIYSHNFCITNHLEHYSIRCIFSLLRACLKRDLPLFQTWRSPKKVRLSACSPHDPPHCVSEVVRQFVEAEEGRNPQILFCFLLIKFRTKNLSDVRVPRAKHRKAIPKPGDSGHKCKIWTVLWKARERK